jgi:hypothetical protein
VPPPAPAEGAVYPFSMQFTRKPLAVIGMAALAVMLAAGCGSEKAASPVGSAATNSTATSEAQDPAAAIVVRKPVSGARVSSGSVVSGTANVFEANVGLEVLDENGHELSKTFTTATCGTGCVGRFSVPVRFEVAREQRGTIVVHDDDAAGTGTPPHVVRVQVVLVPGR